MSLWRGKYKAESKQSLQGETLARNGKWASRPLYITLWLLNQRVLFTCTNGFEKMGNLDYYFSYIITRVNQGIVTGWTPILCKHLRSHCTKES